MERGEVVRQPVDEQDLDHVADFGSDRWTLDSVPWGLWCQCREVGVCIPSVHCLLPLRPEFRVVCGLCPGREIEWDTEPVVKASRGVVPGDFLSCDVVPSNNAAEVEVNGFGTRQSPVQGRSTSSKG